jgi:hypothetical protein
MFLRYYITLFICGEKLSLLIVIALDFLRALLLLIFIALSLQVSVIASLHYRFERHMQALSLLGNGVNLAITLHSEVTFCTAKYSKEPCYF